METRDPIPAADAAPDFTPFLDFIATQRPVLAERLLNILKQNKQYAALDSDEERIQRINQNIDAILAGFEEQETATAIATAFAKSLFPQGIEILATIRIVSIYRQEMLKVGVRAIEQGIPNAATGLTKLLELADKRELAFAVLYEQRLRNYQMTVDNMPFGIGISTLDGHLILYNPAFSRMLGYEESMLGMHFADYSIIDEGAADSLRRTGAWVGINTYNRKDGSSFQGEATVFLLPNSEGQIIALGGVVRDITQQLHLEQERIALQEQMIAMQQATLRELSTPIIPIADGVLAMPLVGTISSERAQMIIEELLQSVSHNQTSTAIIDITGVSLVDTHVAGALVRVAQAVELLGAQVVLTGIRPEVAQTLVSIGVSLGSIITRSTLQEGIKFALSRSR